MRIMSQKPDEQFVSKIIEDEKHSTGISGGMIVEPFKSEIHEYLLNTSEFKCLYFESDNFTDTLLGKKWNAHYLNCPNKNNTALSTSG